MLMHRHLLRSSAGRRLRSAVVAAAPSPPQYPDRWQSQSQSQSQPLRPYSTTTPRFQSSDAAVDDGGDGGDDPSPPGPPTADPRRAASEYNNRRAAYKGAVSKLRKQYAAEIDRQRKSDEQAASRKRALLTRRRLERQRSKNITSAKNAAREEQRRLARAAEFDEELRVAQINRDARKARFAKARQLVVDELEAEAPLWLTTPEEIEAALDAEGEQNLWARPGGVVGAPDPTDDAEFWRFECHTWDMGKTYESSREVLLEELEDVTYLETNVDDKYWTEERLLMAEEAEEKAKLRAMVREEGRRALLARQRRLMQDRYAGEQDRAENERDDHGRVHIPRPMPAPKLDVLANYRAMEEEGVKVLEENPTKFFKFEQESAGGVDDDDDALSAADGGVSATDRSHLGRPLGLRDPVREDSSGMLRGTPYPTLIGRLPRPDTRTEREKKRDEREERMWAAAQEAGGGKDGDDKAIESAAEETLDDGSDPIDYDEIGNAGDEDDIEWEEGIDPETDGDLLSTPREHRYTEEDVDWIVEQLSDKVGKLEELLQVEEESARQELLAKTETDEVSAGDGAGETAAATATAADADEVAKALGESTSRSDGVDERGRNFVQWDNLDSDDDRIFSDDDLTHLDVDVSEINSLLDTLTAEQREAFESMDVSDDVEQVVEDGSVMSADDIASALGKVPGLSKEQVQSMIELEMSLEKNERLREALRNKDDGGEGK